uniref:Uncharacterized protein n=1 Tax=Nelumbo nucifera TaxID=4432 RepID=A0A822ZP54_NELNU|nr:TPA_asm: hypothetical protein HUJ06_002936 [Nelumbo nucifera]
MGINYGQLGNNLPSPSRSIELIKSLKAGRVKHANPDILKALEGTNIQVSIMVPNQLISNISSSQSLANEWVRTNVVPFYPKTLIHYLLVGNKIFSFSSDQDWQTWYDLIQAMRQLKYSLKIHTSETKLGLQLPWVSFNRPSHRQTECFGPISPYW